MTQLKKDLKMKAKGSLLSAPLILRKYIQIKISVSLKLTAIFCGHKNCIALFGIQLNYYFRYYSPCYSCHYTYYWCIITIIAFIVIVYVLTASYRKTHCMLCIECSMVLRFIESFLSYTTMAINSPVNSSLSRHFSRDVASS